MKLPEIPLETIVGEATILQVFQLTGQRKAVVAGCRVKKGTLTVDKDMIWRVFRNEEMIHQGLFLYSFTPKGINCSLDSNLHGLILVDIMAINILTVR